MPYTREEATEITEDFEDLIGTEIVMGDPATEIMYVALAPASFENHKDYAETYHQKIMADPGYVYESRGNLYDVAVIIGEPGHFTLKNIRDYVAEAGIPYNFPA